jgi:type IV secretion system protein VirD4
METPKWAKWLFGILLFIAATAAVIWLSGFMVFVLKKVNPMGKTDFLTWWTYWQYYQHDPVFSKTLKAALMIAALIGYGVPFFAIIAASQKTRALHGEARFARPDEIAKSGLLNGKKGIIVGKYRGKFLIFEGQQFVLLAAPTRSGKGVGVVIPNLLNYPESIVVLDIKQENYDLTAGFRAKHGHRVFLFNPFAEDYRTHRYNPLGYVRDGSFRVGDLAAIGKVFYPAEGKDAFWDDQALNLFIGMGLYLCETPSLPLTIGEMLRQASGKGQPVKDYLQGIIDVRNYRAGTDDSGNAIKKPITSSEWDGTGDAPLSMECVDCLNRFLSSSDNTLASILASLNAPLSMWSNPIIDAATSENDFDLREVRKQRMTIYIGITPDHLHEAGRLVNLFFSQLINLNTKELPQKNPALKYQCLLLMDEFTAIGKVGIVASANAFIAGYNLRLLPIIQSLAQLESVYGKEDARTMVTNHALQIYYAPREQKDAVDYSEMLGYETVKGKSTSRQMGDGRGGRSESSSDQRRALLLPQEIKEIGQWKEIISLENTKPILCDKIKYFEDPVFTARLLPAPTVPLLDLDTHTAKVQGRTRALTVNDLRDGSIPLERLALDTASLTTMAIAMGSGEIEIDGFLDNFFEKLGYTDAALITDEDGSSPSLSPEQLAALDAEADNGMEWGGDTDEEDFENTVEQDDGIDLSLLDMPIEPVDDWA